MALDRKRHFVEALTEHYRELIAAARRAEAASADGAEALQRESRRKDDAKSAAELDRVAAAHRRRRERAKRELEMLIRFAATGLRERGRSTRVDLGALVDVRIASDQEAEERTLFFLPVGAGTELTGPGGDGFVSVVTPESPVGRALQGSAVGDSFEIVIGDREREWTVVDLC